MREGFSSPGHVVRDGAVGLERDGVEDLCGVGVGRRGNPYGMGGLAGWRGVLGASRPSSGIGGVMEDGRFCG